MSPAQPNHPDLLSMQTRTPILTDQRKLIKACIAGERISQAVLYDNYARKMLGICMWYARNKEEAEEILQDGFLRIFRYLPGYNSKGPLENWMRKIMINAALHKYRSKARLNIVQTFDWTRAYLTVDATVLDYLEAGDLLKIVQQLSPGYRMVFNLFVMEGLKHREIAKILGISEGTSKSNLSDARLILQKALSSHKGRLKLKIDR